MQVAAEDLGAASHSRGHPSPCHSARWTADDAYAEWERIRVAAEQATGLIKSLNLT